MQRVDNRTVFRQQETWATAIIFRTLTKCQVVNKVVGRHITTSDSVKQFTSAEICGQSLPSVPLLSAGANVDVDFVMEGSIVL